MTMRLNYGVVAPEAIKAMMGLEQAVKDDGAGTGAFSI